MEHLPLPRSATAHLRVPCICKGQYDNGLFLSFPTRQNWEITLFRQSLEESFLRCGQTPSVEETRVFLQTWLYFGTLYEVFGDSVALSEFITTDEHDNRFLCTAKFKTAVTTLLEQSVDTAAAEEVQLKSLLKLCNNVQSHLNNLYRTLAGVMHVADLATLAGTAVLGEALENTIRRLYTHILEMETRPQLPWGTVSSEWIINHMRSSGWCPSKIARLRSDRTHISLLYYYYQVAVSQKTTDHSACTEGGCLVLKIDPSVYSTAHTDNSCGCPELNLEVREIGRVLGSDKLPLIEVLPSADSASAEIRLREDDGHTGFVAISHVWADGLGNVKNNSLPACSLQDISRMVNQLPRCSSQQSESVPFWIDTICVPVEPAAMKKLALDKLRYPYMRAGHVLVLDNYLRTVKAADCDALELVAHLMCCNWVSRLWTLQEGRLARRVWFQFKDRAVELKALWEETLPTLHPRNKGLHYWDLFITVIASWSATDLFGGTKNKHGSGPPGNLAIFLRQALCFRSVSVPADEALCLFCLADLEMEKITSVQTSAPMRMKTFWSQMQTVPSGFLFSQCPQKLDEPGFRWAPSSFMGALPHNHWAGAPGFEDNSKGRPTSRGLLVNFPGFICNINWEDMEDSGGFFFRGAENWLRLYLEEPWHTTSSFVPSGGPERMAIILMEPLHGRTNRDPHYVFEENEWPSFSVGVLGTLTGNDDASIKYVQCLRHVTVFQMKPLEQFINDFAFKYVSTEVLNKDHSLDLEEWAVRVANACFEEHPEVASACRKWIIGSSYTTAADRFTVRIIELAKPTKQYGGIGEVLMEEQRWCVD